MVIFKAAIADVPELVALLNSAYRGESSKKGWTSEAHLIGSNVRTNDEQLTQVLQAPYSVMLKCVNNAGQIVGCVNLQQQGNKIYLGMLSVSPMLQGKGTGKQLLQAAEVFAKENKCSAIYMTVISVRDELIAWYQRHGYVVTGETKPFVQDDITGNHLQPLVFAVLEKQLL